jgi:hypothetical protein
VSDDNYFFRLTTPGFPVPSSCSRHRSFLAGPEPDSVATRIASTGAGGGGPAPPREREAQETTGQKGQLFEAPPFELRLFVAAPCFSDCSSR